MIHEPEQTASRALQVVPLSPELAHWWTEAGPAVADADQLTAQIRDFLSAGTPSALFVVLDGERAIARLQARPVGACGLGLFAIGFRDGLSRAKAGRAADALLDVVEAFVTILPGVTYIDTDVPSQAPCQEVWRAALERHGVVEVAASHSYERPLGPLASVEDERLSFRPVSDMPRELVESVYEATYADTGDASHRLSPETFSVRLERLRELPLLAEDPSGWLVAYDADEPVGLVFASVECAPHGSAERGWILEIGVVPAARGRGLGKKLLSQGLFELGERGVTQALARIDVANTPSLRLFAAAGFTQQDEECWVHRKVW